MDFPFLYSSIQDN